jgi:hypothetical protein
VDLNYCTARVDTRNFNTKAIDVYERVSGERKSWKSGYTLTRPSRLGLVTAHPILLWMLTREHQDPLDSGHVTC